ncbi:hypothetical protein SAMN04487936_10656 [Halobacillus dabanensis]|uniref:Uncharacterized protein n=1 Tax=Halobacillus dabanensis TaxID=240302 RepID=A0A1I3VYC3_HALDA|nr:hypothetical protein [Halobacillus dabanensis]SFJ99216.1 hypothetical protein SAMN04487936_10656 [Halobacillus dabanensis]
MLIIIMLVVAVYSSLMVYLLAKVGNAPAQSVLDMLRGKSARSPKKTYEQSISAR